MTRWCRTSRVVESQVCALVEATIAEGLTFLLKHVKSPPASAQLDIDRAMVVVASTQVAGRFASSALTESGSRVRKGIAR